MTRRMLALALSIGMSLMGLSLSIDAQSAELDLGELPVALPAITFSEQDYELKPLVDTSGPSEKIQSNGFHNGTDAATEMAPKPETNGAMVLKGDAHHTHAVAGMVPVSDNGPRMLTGKVQTLQEAIESESGNVDWYAWYLSARAYLGRTGGLQCALGTPIKFYRNGQIEALSFNPLCQASVAGRRFPLPPKTKLEALILPVRAGEGPPASPEEIYTRIQSGH